MRRLNDYNKFILKLIKYFEKIGKETNLEYFDKEKRLRLHAHVWDKISSVQIINRVNHLEIIFQFCRIYDINKENARSVFYRRSWEYPDLINDQEGTKFLTLGIFKQAAKCSVANILALEFVDIDNVDVGTIGSHINAAMAYCEKQWKRSAPGHLGFLDDEKKKLMNA